MDVEKTDYIYKKEASFSDRVKILIEKHPYAVLGGGLASLGAGVGAIEGHYKIKADLAKKKGKSRYAKTRKGYKLNRTKEYGGSILSGAIPLGLLGLRLAALGSHGNRRSSEQTSSFGRRRVGEPHWKDLAFLGVEKGDIKTKKDLHSVYKKVMMKEHPDKGGSTIRSKAVNAAMKEIKNTDWYNKLASNYRGSRRFEKMARVMHKRND